VACDAKLAFEAKLQGSERWYASDHGVDSLRIQSNNGWRRGAIELPPATQGSQVEALRFVVYAGKTACPLLLTDVRKVFLLSQDYVPGPTLLTWHGEQLLDADPATASPDSLLLPAAK
jgi:hypothetical protein